MCDSAALKFNHRCYWFCFFNFLIFNLMIHWSHRLLKTVPDSNCAKSRLIILLRWGVKEICVIHLICNSITVAVNFFLQIYYFTWWVIGRSFKKKKYLSAIVCGRSVLLYCYENIPNTCFTHCGWTVSSCQSSHWVTCDPSTLTNIEVLWQKTCSFRVRVGWVCK